VFFSSCYRRNCVLHSFPTRRSSDLERCRVDRDLGPHVPLGMLKRLFRCCPREALHAPAAERSAGCGEYDAFDRTSIGTGEHLKRSEEHTSELQSRENLVCRLLLEKK